jgi:Fic family protein
MLDNLSKLKKKLDSLRPFPPEALDNLEKWFEVELTYTSNAIEGNTLTRAETALVLEAAPEKDENQVKLLKIWTLAKETLETISTIRYWSKIGLLEVASTTESGYQLYSQEMILRIQKIRVLQEKRHTLEEIMKILVDS